MAVLCPRRNIETWIAYLRGQATDEQTAYAKLRLEKDCRPLVARLKKMCDSGALDSPPVPPPSLVAACQEWRERSQRFAE